VYLAARSTTAILSNSAMTDGVLPLNRPCKYKNSFYVTERLVLTGDQKCLEIRGGADCIGGAVLMNAEVEGGRKTPTMRRCGNHTN
jgi:hypothetical protein